MLLLITLVQHTSTWCDLQVSFHSNITAISMRKYKKYLKVHYSVFITKHNYNENCRQSSESIEMDLMVLFFFLLWRFWCMDQQRQPSIWSNTVWKMFVPMFMLPKLEKQLMSPQIYVLTRYASEQTRYFLKTFHFVSKWRFTVHLVWKIGPTLWEADEQCAI